MTENTGPEHDRSVIAQTPQQSICEDLDVSRISVERMVGRREELSALLDLEASARDGRPGVALVAGDAGIGKTRIVDEFLGRLPAGTRSITGRCDALGDVVPIAAISSPQSVSRGNTARRSRGEGSDERGGGAPARWATTGAPLPTKAEPANPREDLGGSEERPFEAKGALRGCAGRVLGRRIDWSSATEPDLCS